LKCDGPDLTFHAMLSDEGCHGPMAVSRFRAPPVNSPVTENVLRIILYVDSDHGDVVVQVFTFAPG
jgi:hypothetical protein